jgi:hypothetical protein
VLLPVRCFASAKLTNDEGCFGLTVSREGLIREVLVYDSNVFSHASSFRVVSNYNYKKFVFF